MVSKNLKKHSRWMHILHRVCRSVKRCWNEPALSVQLWVVAAIGIAGFAHEWLATLMFGVDANRQATAMFFYSWALVGTSAFKIMSLTGDENNPNFGPIVFIILATVAFFSTIITMVLLPANAILYFFLLPIFVAAGLLAWCIANGDDYKKPNHDNATGGSTSRRVGGKGKYQNNYEA